MLRGALHDQQLLCLYKVSDSALQVYSVLAALSLLLHAHASVRPFCEQGGSLKSAHMGIASSQPMTHAKCANCHSTPASVATQMQAVLPVQPALLHCCT